MSSRVSSSALLHEHDPTMDARIVHAVNVSNKKELSQLRHKAKSLAGSRDVSMHIYRQEEKELVKHLFKLQSEKERRHPEIGYRRRTPSDRHPETEKLIQSQDFNHGGSATHQEYVVPAQDSRTSHPQGSGSNTSLLQQYLQDAVYQPVGYGHGSKEYVGVTQDIGHRRHNSVPGEFRSHTMTSHPTLSHPTVANAMPSRHQIDTTFHPQRQQSKTMTFLDPSTQLKTSSHSSEVHHPRTEEQRTDETDEEKNQGSSSASPGEMDATQQSGGRLSKAKSQTSQKSREKLVNSRAGPRRSNTEDQQTKRRTVMFATKTPSYQSPPKESMQQQETAVEGSAHNMAGIGATSSMECMYDPHEIQHRRESTRAIIEQEHEKLDSIIQSFRQAFPVKKELDWQKTHSRPSESSRRGPFVAHTPPHQVSSKDSSINSVTNRIHHQEGSYADTDHHHAGAHVSHVMGKPHHQYSHSNFARASHGNVSRHNQGSSYTIAHGSRGNVSSVRESQFNVARAQRQSHANIGPHISAASQSSVGRRDNMIGSIYNLPKEAVADYRNLMEQASYSAHHPSTREPHTSNHRTAGIPHSHPPRRNLKKSRQKLLALHLLANQQRQANMDRAVAQPPEFNPTDTLMCRYLRLSSLNVETLVDMCNESGVPIGIHPHMTIEDVSKFVFKDEKSSPEQLSVESLDHSEQSSQPDKRISQEETPDSKHNQHNQDDEIRPNEDTT